MSYHYHLEQSKLLRLTHVDESPITTSANRVSNIMASNEQTAFCAPGISTLLSMCYLGTGSDSATRDQMFKVLGFAEDEYVHKELREYCDTINRDNAVQNFFAFYVKDTYELDVDFITNLIRYGDFQNVEFNENDRAELNMLVEKNTDGMIKNCISDSFDPSLRLFLLNTLLCNIKFSYPFFKNKTTETDFNRFDGSTVPVPMMSKMCDQYDEYVYNDTDEYQAIELQCKDTDCVFGIILPREGLEPKHIYDINPNDIVFKRTKEVLLFLPRFTIEKDHDIVPELMKMGLSLPFSDDADFSKISKSGTTDLFIGKIIQKVKIEVDEEGVKAAAVSYNDCLLLCDDYLPTVAMNCNRTFCGYIRLGSNILFRFTYDGK